MKRSLLRFPAVLLVSFCVMVVGSVASGSAVLFGDYYRLGDNDKGAVAGNVGSDLTLDLGFYQLDLGRTGLPTYSADTSSRAVESKLSMSFFNVSGVGSLVSLPSYYSRSSPLTTDQQGYGLETWVKTRTLTPVDASGYALIAYDGEPGKTGFGFFQHGSDYVIRIGGTEKVLGPASTTEWTHLAYVHTFDTDSFYVFGQRIGEGKADPASAATSGAFMLGGNPLDAQHLDLFNGLIDETRFFSFNPLAAGAPGGTDFLISPAVPEPSGILGLGGVLLLLGRRRTRMAA